MYTRQFQENRRFIIYTKKFFVEQEVQYLHQIDLGEQEVEYIHQIVLEEEEVYFLHKIVLKEQEVYYLNKIVLSRTGGLFSTLDSSTRKYNQQNRRFSLYTRQIYQQSKISKAGAEYYLTLPSVLQGAEYYLKLPPVLQGAEYYLKLPLSSKELNIT